MSSTPNRAPRKRLRELATLQSDEGMYFEGTPFNVLLEVPQGDDATTPGFKPGQDYPKVTPRSVMTQIVRMLDASKPLREYIGAATASECFSTQSTWRNPIPCPCKPSILISGVLSLDMGKLRYGLGMRTHAAGLFDFIDDLCDGLQTTLELHQPVPVLCIDVNGFVMIPSDLTNRGG